jgi:hypothetical protein
MATTKNFKTWLIVDWKTSRVRTVKRKGKIKPTEIAIELDLDVVIPDEAIMKAKGTIELSQTKVNDLVLEELES